MKQNSTHWDHRNLVIRTLETRSTSTTNLVTARNILEGIIYRQKINQLYVCICIYSNVDVMIDFILSVHGDITCDMMSYDIKYSITFFGISSNN